MFADAARAGRFTMIESAIINESSWNAGDRTATFFVNESLDSLGTTHTEWVERNSRFGTASSAVTVPAVDFVHCLRTYGVPHFMKIDIEGSDRFCLESLRHVGEPPDFVSIESERTDAIRARTELDLLESLGYARFQIVQQIRVPWQKVPRPSREGHDCTHRFPRHASGLFGSDLPTEGWMDREHAAKVYEANIAREIAFGERSLLRRIPGVGRVFWTIEKHTGLPLPGWCDTHARLGPAWAGGEEPPARLAHEERWADVRHHPGEAEDRDAGFRKADATLNVCGKSHP